MQDPPEPRPHALKTLKSLCEKPRPQVLHTAHEHPAASILVLIDVDSAATIPYTFCGFRGTCAAETGPDPVLFRKSRNLSTDGIIMERERYRSATPSVPGLHNGKRLPCIQASTHA